MIGFAFAMDKEANPFLEGCRLLETKKSGYAKLVKAEYAGKEILVIVSGIGKGFACAAIAAAKCLYPELEAVINLGVCGSQNKAQADIFSCVIGSHFVEHDLDTTAIGDPKAMVSGINLVELPSDKKLNEGLAKACLEAGIPSTEAVVSSGDVFIVDKEAKHKITEEFGSLCLDMESAPFAQIAYAYHLPFAVARIVSDAEHPDIEYAKYSDEAAVKAASVGHKFLEII